MPWKLRSARSAVTSSAVMAAVTSCRGVICGKMADVLHAVAAGGAAGPDAGRSVRRDGLTMRVRRGRRPNSLVSPDAEFYVDTTVPTHV
jgi:hypothetical protein